MTRAVMADCVPCSQAVRTAKPPPPGYRPFLERNLFTDCGVYERATQADWVLLVAQMTDVQRLVHLAGRMTTDDIEELADRVFDVSRETYRQTLAVEAARLGCHGGVVMPAAGPELTAVRNRADWAANSVGHTYNVELARAIVRIGEETPTANRHVYAHRLYYANNNWDKRYWEAKAIQIGETEAMLMVNSAIDDFYARNGDLVEAEANAVPVAAVCLLCQDWVGGSPYASVNEAYLEFSRLGLPHVGCPHHVEPSPERKLTSEECQDLWTGM